MSLLTMSMSQPTYDDVNLLLRLYELRREEKIRAARVWFVSNFKCKTMAEFGKLCPPGSDTNASFRQFTSYWEMAASFVNSGVLNPELCFANCREMLLCWVRVKPLVGEMRQAYGDSSYMAHLEKAGDAYASWLVKNGGADAYDGFVKRVG
jgi:hypothetical protein